MMRNAALPKTTCSTFLLAKVWTENGLASALAAFTWPSAS